MRVFVLGASFGFFVWAPSRSVTLLCAIRHGTGLRLHTVRMAVSVWATVTGLAWLRGQGKGLRVSILIEVHVSFPSPRRERAGIMENIFDGIQRPLQLIYDEAGHSPFVPLGVDVAALNRYGARFLCVVNLI